MQGSKLMPGYSQWGWAGTGAEMLWEPGEGPLGGGWSLEASLEEEVTRFCSPTSSGDQYRSSLKDETYKTDASSNLLP